MDDEETITIDKTIVLDLDLTLVCTIGDGSDLSHKLRTEHKADYEDLVERNIIVPSTITQYGGSGKAYHNDIIKRPGLEQFLTFCKNTFRSVILWSAGQPSYVFDVVKKVIDPMERGIFDQIYTSQDIVQFPGDKYTPPCLSKPLSLVIDNNGAESLESVVIVDDLLCNFASNPLNGILIPPFQPKICDILKNSFTGPFENMCDDYYLFSLIHFLSDKDFLFSKDVRDVDLKFF